MSATIDRTDTDDAALAQLMGEPPLPDKVWLLVHEATNRYGCMQHEGVHGVAAFSREGGAFRVAELIDLSGMSTKEVDFDEARDIAKARPLPVTALMLCDDRDNPQIHYVR